MLKETQQVLEILSNDYNLDTDKIVSDITEVNDQTDYVKIGSIHYVIHAGLDDQQVEDKASYIYNVMPNQFKVFKEEESTTADNDVEEISEAIDVNDVKEGEVYIYQPKYMTEPYITDKDDFVNETKLQTLAKYNPYCKVKEVLVISKEEKDIFVVVNFDIDENKDKNLPEDMINEDYIVFADDLAPIVEEKVEDVVTENEDVVVDDKDTEVEESLEQQPENNETSTALLTALNSEKEAVMTYEMLLKLTNEEDVIQLLQKILDDEKEHIALLSGLQSSKVADFVAEDNKEQLDGYAEDIINSDS